MEEKVARPRPRKPVGTLRIAVAVSFSPEELQVLEGAVTKLNVTRSQFIRDAVRHYLMWLNKNGQRQGEKEEGAGKEAGEKDIATQVSL